jgi:hypothetical protein
VDEAYGHLRSKHESAQEAAGSDRICGSSEIRAGNRTDIQSGRALADRQKTGRFSRHIECLVAVLVSRDYSARVSGTAGGLLGGGFPILSSALPEPDGWTMLLCGLVVVGFMARRKTDLLAG